jgi:hypothetical protein
MPDNPGGDPIPPKAIWQAIHDGATYKDGLLDGNRIDAAGNLAPDGPYQLDDVAYVALWKGSVDGMLILGGRAPMVLVPQRSWLVVEVAPKDAT